MNRLQLRTDIEKEEGRVPYAYKDSLGLWTCGVGFLIDKDRGGRIPDKVIDYWLDLKLDEVQTQLYSALPWLSTRPEPCQRALMEMAYQMGVQGLLAFTDTLKAIQAGDYQAARSHALASVWATQTPDRAKRVTDKFVMQ